MGITAYELASKELISVDLNATIEEVMQVFLDTGKRFLFVLTEDGKNFGVVTCMDVNRFLLENHGVKGKKVWEICSHDQSCVFTDKQANMTVEEAAKTMLDSNLHHLIFCNSKACNPVGILSSQDILRYFLDTSIH